MEFVNQNMQVIVAAVAALAVLLIVIAGLRSFGGRVGGRRGQRLGISEYHELDKTRRLVLVRRDNVEHLILIGGPHDLVVESGITASGIAASYAPAPPMGLDSIAPVPRQAPRPAVFGDRKPPQLRPAEPLVVPARRGDPDIE